MSFGNFDRRRLLGGGLAILALPTLGACGTIIGDREPPRIFQLTSVADFPPELPRVEWQIVLEAPNAPSTINTSRIGLMSSPVEFDYYANVGWSDRAPIMVQSLLLESFENSGKIVAVDRDTAGLRPDFMLRTELREFQAQVSNGMHRVVVSMTAKLVRMPQREIIASTQISDATLVDPQQMTTVINAFDQTLGNVITSLVAWTLREGELAYHAGARAQQR